MRTYCVSPEKLSAAIAAIEAKYPCSRSEYTTFHFAERKYEVHRKFIDVQFVEQGEEFVHVAEALSPLESFNEEKDCGFFAKQFRPDATVCLRPGLFCVVFAGEAHMPNVETDKGQGRVLKRVAKVPFSDFLANPLLFDELFG